jgi:hypothetical protein
MWEKNLIRLGASPQARQPRREYWSGKGFTVRRLPSVQTGLPYGENLAPQTKQNHNQEV